MCCRSKLGVVRRTATLTLTLLRFFEFFHRGGESLIFADRLEIRIVLEVVEVVEAELDRLVQQLERLVAKGYASSRGLETRQIEVGLAEKQLQRARLRLETLKKSAGQSEPPPKRP